MKGTTYMEVDNLYRLNTPTLAIDSSDDNKRVPLLIPAGAVVRLMGTLNGGRLVDVAWDGKTVAMFTLDLQHRGTKME